MRSLGRLPHFPGRPSVDGRSVLPAGAWPASRALIAALVLSATLIAQASAPDQRTPAVADGGPGDALIVVPTDPETPKPTPTRSPTFVPVTSGVRLPASIDATGATNVSAALTDFLATVPDGSTIAFAPNGRYRVQPGFVC